VKSLSQPAAQPPDQGNEILPTDGLPDRFMPRADGTKYVDEHHFDGPAPGAAEAVPGGDDPDAQSGAASSEKPN